MCYYMSACQHIIVYRAPYKTQFSETIPSLFYLEWYFDILPRQRGFKGFFADGWNCKRGLSTYFRASYTLLMAAILQSHTLPLLQMVIAAHIEPYDPRMGEGIQMRRPACVLKIEMFWKLIFCFNRIPNISFWWPQDNRGGGAQMMHITSIEIASCPIPPPRPPSHPSPRPHWR